MTSLFALITEPGFNHGLVCEQSPQSCAAWHLQCQSHETSPLSPYPYTGPTHFYTEAHSHPHCISCQADAMLLTKQSITCSANVHHQHQDLCFSLMSATSKHSALFLCKCYMREESWDLSSKDHNAQLCAHSMGSMSVLHWNEHS